MSFERVILHADMDAFYASVEQRDRPELRGKPVIVGGGGPRGVVSASSYEARVFGVRSAMPGFEARRLCPDGIFLRGDMRKYVAVSRQVFEVFGRFSPLVEAISLDEAFLDLTGTERLHGPPRRAGEALRRAVREATGLAVSVGIAPIKMVAKIASDEAKPDGLLEILPGEVRGFLDPLPVGRLWGVGLVAEARLRAAGIETIGDLARRDEARLRELLGEALGAHAFALAGGRDPRDVVPDRAAVSYSEENTFDTDVTDRTRIGAVVHDHAESVARRLRRDELVARTLVLKVKLAKRRAPGPRGHPILTRRTTLAEPSDDGATFAREAKRMLEKLPPDAIRLVGVGATNLVSRADAQLGLFEPSEQRRRSARLNRALDAITDRFGARAVVRAGQEQATRAALSHQRKRGERDDLRASNDGLRADDDGEPAASKRQQRIGGTLRTSSAKCVGSPNTSRASTATRSRTWYATKQPVGASASRIERRMESASGRGIVENGMPDTTASGAARPCAASAPPMSSALPQCTTSRGSAMRARTRSARRGLISIASRCASGRIARNRACVVPPVPGPSSTTTLARSSRAQRVTRRSRKRELGMIEPTSLGLERNDLKKSTGASVASLAFSLARVAFDFAGRRVGCEWTFGMRSRVALGAGRVQGATTHRVVRVTKPALCGCGAQS
jgi:DNA polymerase-4